MSERKTLYKLVDDLQAAILEAVDPATGELIGTDEMVQRIDALSGDAEAKCLGTALYIKGCRQEASGPHAIADRIMEDAETLAESYRVEARKLERQADGLADYLEHQMKRLDIHGETLKDERVKIAFTRSQAASVVEGKEHLVPDVYRNPPPKVVPRKPGLKLLLDAMKEEESEELTAWLPGMVAGADPKEFVYAIRERRVAMKVS